MFREARDLGTKYSLRRDKVTKVALSPQSVVDLMSATSVLRYPVRYRLSNITYYAMAAVTGLRASSMIRTWGKARDVKRRTGLTWGNLFVWVVPGCDSDQGNDVIVDLKPKWSKTFWGSATTFPLVSGPHLAASANMLVLLLFRSW